MERSEDEKKIRKKGNFLNALRAGSWSSFCPAGKSFFNENIPCAESSCLVLLIVRVGIVKFYRLIILSSFIGKFLKKH